MTPDPLAVGSLTARDVRVLTDREHLTTNERTKIVSDSDIKRLGKQVADLTARRAAAMDKLVPMLVEADRASGGKRRAELAKLSGLSRETLYQRLRAAGQVEARRPAE